MYPPWKTSLNAREAGRMFIIKLETPLQSCKQTNKLDSKALCLQAEMCLLQQTNIVLHNCEKMKNVSAILTKTSVEMPNGFF